MIKKVDIKEGAVFIADVHYKKGDKTFLSFLEDLNKNPPPQLFLLGDIFHLLLPFKYLENYNKEAINLINLLSTKTEIYYVYGNHDFCIDNMFQNVTFAMAFVDEKKSIYITHGDLENETAFYKLYTKFIRNRVVLYFLNIISFNFVNNWLFKKLLNKKIRCKSFNLNFKTEKLYRYIIIGHYHIKKHFDKIYTLGAFFCDKKYYIIQLDKKIKVKEMYYGR